MKSIPHSAKKQNRAEAPDLFQGAAKDWPRSMPTLSAAGIAPPFIPSVSVDGTYLIDVPGMPTTERIASRYFSASRYFVGLVSPTKTKKQAACQNQFPWISMNIICHNIDGDSPELIVKVNSRGMDNSLQGKKDESKSGGR